MWTRLDDGFCTNPKVWRAGKAATGLYAMALSWCGEQLTDGFIGEAAMRMLLDDGERPLVDGLLGAGLIVTTEGGYLIPDYLEFNPSREQVRAQHAAHRDRQRRYRASQDASRDGARDAEVTRTSGARVDPTRPEDDPDTRRPEDDPVRGTNVPSGGKPPGHLLRARTREAAVIENVFEAWRQSVGRHGVQLTEKRRKRIRARLAEGYAETDLVDAVRGWERDPWPERRLQNELEILLRDGSQVEKFRDLQRNGAPAIVQVPRDVQEQLAYHQAMQTQIDRWTEGERHGTQ
jgi:hypothetical protein